MPTEDLTIASPRGHALSGALDLPEGPVRGAALYAHCFTCTKQSRAAVAVSRALADGGIACLRFDFTGLGESGGDFGADSFPADVADVKAVTAALVDRFGPGVLLVGHSLGGAAVLAVADELAEVAAVATIGAPAAVSHVTRQLSGDLDAVERTGEGEVMIGGRPFTITRKFLDNLHGTDLAAEVGELDRPLLILHSPTDQLVGIENAARLFEAARHPKSFVSLAGADHLLLDARDAEFAAAVIVAWASRYLPDAA